MHANVALQVRAANAARVEHTVWTKERDLHALRAILTKAVDSEEQHIRVKLFRAPPHEPEAAHSLIARQRVAAGGLHIFHVAAENRGKQAGEKLRDGADQILLMANHVRRNFPGGRLGKSCRKR